MVHMITDRSHVRRKETLSKGFDLYQTYVAMNLHMNPNTDYDFSRYNGKVRGSIDKFNKSPAKHRFCAIARNMDKDRFIVAMYSMSRGNSKHIVERTVTPKNAEHHFKKVVDEITTWENGGLAEDIQSMKDDGAGSFRDVMLTDDDQAPLIIRKYLANEIDWKTLANFRANYSTNILRKYTDSSFRTMIKMAFDKIDEHLYFVGSVSQLKYRIHHNNGFDWGN